MHLRLVYLSSRRSFLRANLPQLFLVTSCVNHGGSSIRVIISFACSVNQLALGSRGGVFIQPKATVSLRFVVKDSPVCYLASIELTCLFFCFSKAWEWHGGRMLKSSFSFFTSNDRVVYDIYDIGPRIVHDNCHVLLRSCTAGELLCRETGSDAAWTSTAVTRQWPSAVARVDSK